jgi:dipeptidyl aminopeptidase/acylaminoacyl peptidase
MLQKRKKWNIAIYVFCFMLLLGLLVQADDKRPFNAKDILRLKTPSDPQVSPSGKWVAFVVSQFDENHKRNSAIWLASTDGLTLSQITENPGLDRAPRWSPDESTIAFISKKGELKTYQIFLYDVKNGTTKKLTNEPASIEDLKWSPDNKSIAFIMRDAQTIEEAERFKRGDDAYVVDHNYKHTRLYELDIETGKTRLITHQDMTIWHFNWSPDSQKIVALLAPIPTAEGNEYQSHLSVIDINNGEETVLADKTNALVTPSFSPDGKWVVYMGPIGTFKERGIIKVISAEGGKPIELLRDYDGNVWDVTWHPRKNELLATIARGPIHTFSFVSLDGNLYNHFEMYHSMIPYWDAIWSVSANIKYITYLAENIDHPREVWVASLDGSWKKRLTDFNDYLKEVKLGAVEAIKWKNNKDGAEVEGIVVKPIDFEAGKRYPLIVWLHGGPAYNWSLGVQLTNWAQLFASQGYLVLLPNFRGSSGYGMKWMMANVGKWGEGPMSDVMSGVEHLISTGWADEKNLFVGGGSYGGYLTSWIITQTTKFNAAYMAAGVTDLITEYALTDEPSFLIGYFNSAPYDNPEIYRKNSPITYASQVKTPVLIVHGENDLRVPISQSYEFYSALKHYNARAQFVVYPREYHGVREYDHQIDLMKRLLDWFEDHHK